MASSGGSPLVVPAPTAGSRLQETIAMDALYQKRITLRNDEAVRRAAASSRVPVFPCQGQSAVPVDGLGEKGLIDAVPACPELVGRPGQVQPPQPVRPIAGGATCLVPSGFKSLQPLSESEHVVLPQTFHVPHLEAASLGRKQRCPQRQQFSVGEDVVVGEGWPGVGGNAWIGGD